MVKQKATDQGGNQLAMIVYPANIESGHEVKPLAATPGWGEGKPEVSRKFDDVFRGLALGIKYQGTSVEALGRGLDASKFSDPRDPFAAHNRWPGELVTALLGRDLSRPSSYISCGAKAPHSTTSTAAF